MASSAGQVPHLNPAVCQSQGCADISITMTKGKTQKWAKTKKCSRAGATLSGPGVKQLRRSVAQKFSSEPRATFKNRLYGLYRWNV